MNTKKILIKFKNLGSPNPWGEKNLLSMLAALKKEKRQDPKLTIRSSLHKLRPGITILPQIRAGKVVYYPAYLSENGTYFYSIKWLYKAALTYNRRKILLFKHLASEIINTLKRRGLAFKSRVDLIKSIRGCRVNLRRRYKRTRYRRPVYYSNTFKLIRLKRFRLRRYIRAIKRKFSKKKFSKKYLSKKKFSVKQSYNKKNPRKSVVKTVIKKISVVKPRIKKKIVRKIYN